MNKALLIALFVVMLLVSGGAYLLCQVNPQFSFPVLMGANILMFIISLATFFIVQKTFTERPEAFVRGVMSGTMVKMFACVIAIIIYMALNKQHLYKPQLFVLMGIYAFYSVVETVLLSRTAKATR